MSVPEAQAARFLAPLRGRLAVFVLHDSRTKLLLSQFILGCASLRSMRVSILDTDAFYCTNMERITEGAGPATDGELILLPDQDLAVSSVLPLLSSRRELLILDDLNSLQSLASGEHRSQQLSIFMRLLSHNARSNFSWTIATAYGVEPSVRKDPNPRSLASFGDVLIETESAGGSVRLNPGLKGEWPEGELALN